MFCLESREIMPASEEEITEAQEEGITLNCGWGPKEILTENGKVKGIVFKKCLSVFDENKRFAPKFDEAVTMTVPCERVFLSIGQSCLGCGASVVDENKCIGCGVCTTKCEFDAIHLYREHPECSTMHKSEDKMKVILPYAFKREMKIRFGKKEK